MSAKEFEDQRICVVGGTAGIGKAIARRVAMLGGSVIIAGRNADRASRVAQELGHAVQGRALDVLSDESVRAFFESLGAIDHLVVTAAQVRASPFRTTTLDDALFTVKGKFWSQYSSARHAQVRRSILLFSGTLSRKPRAGMAMISAANGAIEALGRALAVELAPVRVNVVSPGLVQGTDAYADMPEAALQKLYATSIKKLPARVVGDGDSIATVATAVLASPYITGAVIDVDGGGLLI